MDGSKYLLDTNIIIAYFNREDAIRKRLEGIAAFLSSVVLGELYYGAYKSSYAASNLRQIEDLIAICVILVCDDVTADHYGQIKNLLRARGRPSLTTTFGLPHSPNSMA